MPDFDFTTFYDQYPDIIRQMPPVFDSHEFILKLTQKNQSTYIKALGSFLPGADQVTAPFQILDAILAEHLKHCVDLIEMVRADKPGTDIFGVEITCTEWRKKSQKKDPYPFREIREVDSQTGKLLDNLFAASGRPADAYDSSSGEKGVNNTGGKIKDFRIFLPSDPLYEKVNEILKSGGIEFDKD